MIIKFDGTPLSLQEKQQIAKKRGEPVVTDQTSKNSGSDNSEKREVSDVISIRNENKLAASRAIRTMEEAESLVDMLKNKFKEDIESSINAHKKTDPDTVMQFYPFE